MNHQKAKPHPKRRDRPYLAITLLGVLLLGIVFAGMGTPRPVIAQGENPDPPGQVVKLVFIHHSTGENWLADEDGGLGLALGNNNYFVSDTNYGWGPDSIGDRTDILDWPEWFTGPSSDTYLDALYNLSEQNSWYTRQLADPGGENQVIMFKSCFPNSNLEGSPNDPPTGDDYLTVGSAKRVYNDLLSYFATRQDRLFVVITAPPVQDPDYSANARAFNTWLMHDWLRDYPYQNVAVFDFYNVLTTNGGDPYVNDYGRETGNHHRFHSGVIQHITDGDDDGNPNVLEYPSDGDDHPSQAGNQKATGEFVPMLNIFYHRWMSAAPSPEPGATAPPPAPTQAPDVEEPETEEPAAAEEPPAGAGLPTLGAGATVDDFEGAYDPDQDWEVWADEQADTSMAVARDNEVAHSGSSSLRLEFDIAPGSWADFGHSFDPTQDWSDGAGLSMWLRFSEAAATEQGMSVILVAGNPDAPRPFEVWFEILPESADSSGWIPIELPWDRFSRAEWADEGGLSEFDPSRVTGIDLSFGAPDDSRLERTVWVDDISLLGQAPQPAPTEAGPETPAVAPAAEATATQAPVTEAPTAPPPPAPEASPEDEDEGGGLCPISVGLALAGLVLVRRGTARQ